MKKKYIIIFITIIVIICGVVTAFFMLKGNKNEKKNDEKITIKFDTNGGEEVLDMEVKKDEKIMLPSTNKEGYFFNGWYLNEEKLEGEVSFAENVTLVAKWDEIPETVKTFEITFNSNGGTKVNNLIVECDQVLPTLPTSKKDGYNFVSWADQNGKVILSGALLSCENITLYANWEEVKKVYTCPSGYNLNGTKCTTTTTAKEKCGERGFDYNGKCVTITGNARKDTQKSCPKEHITYMSYAGQTDGKVVNWGVWGCAYYKTNDVSKDTCESHGFKWVTPENACYVKWTSNSTINSCDYLSGYVHITDPNTYNGVNGLNGGCFPLSEKEKYCDDGFTLNGNSCVKTIDATLK